MGRLLTWTVTRTVPYRAAINHMTAKVDQCCHFSWTVSEGCDRSACLMICWGSGVDEAAEVSHRLRVHVIWQLKLCDPAAGILGDSSCVRGGNGHCSHLSDVCVCMWGKMSESPSLYLVVCRGFCPRHTQTHTHYHTASQGDLRLVGSIMVDEWVKAGCPAEQLLQLLRSGNSSNLEFNGCKQEKTRPKSGCTKLYRCSVRPSSTCCLHMWLMGAWLCDTDVLFYTCYHRVQGCWWMMDILYWSCREEIMLQKQIR